MEIGWKRVMKKGYKYGGYFEGENIKVVYLFGFFNYIKCQTYDFKRKKHHFNQNKLLSRDPCTSIDHDSALSVANKNGQNFNGIRKMRKIVIWLQLIHTYLGKIYVNL